MKAKRSLGSKALAYPPRYVVTKSRMYLPSITGDDCSGIRLSHVATSSYRARRAQVESSVGVEGTQVHHTLPDGCLPYDSESDAFSLSPRQPPCAPVHQRIGCNHRSERCR